LRSRSSFIINPSARPQRGIFFLYPWAAAAAAAAYTNQTGARNGLFLATPTLVELAVPVSSALSTKKWRQNSPSLNFKFSHGQLFKTVHGPFNESTRELGDLSGTT
jgi:hypothetical protein